MIRSCPSWGNQLLFKMLGEIRLWFLPLLDKPTKRQVCSQLTTSPHDKSSVGFRVEKQDQHVGSGSWSLWWKCGGDTVVAVNLVLPTVLCHIYVDKEGKTSVTLVIC